MKGLKWLILLISLQSCIHTAEKPQNERTFNAPKGLVWESLITVLKPYPTDELNEKKGFIKTEEMNINTLWKPVNKKKPLGFKYSLSIYIRPKNPLETRVIVIKKIKNQKTFFSKTYIIPSDLLEEDEILYRLGREIKIRKLIKKLKNRND